MEKRVRIVCEVARAHSGLSTIGVEHERDLRIFILEIYRCIITAQSYFNRDLGLIRQIILQNIEAVIHEDN